MSTNNGALVRVENVEKLFRRGSEEIHVLSGLSLAVPEGEFLALMRRPAQENPPCSI